MLIPILTLAVLAVAQDPASPAPAARTEAQMAADLHARAVIRCETTPRGEGESVAACADRRVAALMGTYGTVVRALAATSGWVPDEGGATSGSLGFPTLTDGLAPEMRASPSRDRTYQPPQPRCRRETMQNEDGSSSSTTLICGNGGESERVVRETLDRLSRPQD